MKKVGIITMHRPISFGSSLQAYALQKMIENYGYECEIIDYQYPNKLHKNKLTVLVVIRYLIHYFMNIFMGMPCLVEQTRFRQFRKQYLHLSRHYEDNRQLYLDPPHYDIYCTGSDQVWNSNFTKSDTTFLLSFVDDVKKISYASSFAVDYIAEEYIDAYTKYLSKYSFISVREQSGIKLLKTLTGQNASLVCDPTLLLRKEEWYPLIEESRIRIDSPYILVFLLTYSYNPYPEVNRIIDHIQEKLGLPVIVLSGNKRDYFRKNTRVIKNAGPLEFLYLFQNASYIITSSFHGAAFSVNFEKPFIAVVDRKNKDSRIMSFLQHIGLENYAVGYNESLNDINLSPPDVRGLEMFRSESFKYLESALIEVH